jgi:hypothetical protein
MIVAARIALKDANTTAQMTSLRIFVFMGFSWGEFCLHLFSPEPPPKVSGFFC